MFSGVEAIGASVLISILLEILTPADFFELQGSLSITKGHRSSSAAWHFL